MRVRFVVVRRVFLRPRREQNRAINRLSIFRCQTREPPLFSPVATCPRYDRGCPRPEGPVPTFIQGLAELNVLFSNSELENSTK